jgi:hypothetical protein
VEFEVGWVTGWLTGLVEGGLLWFEVGCLSLRWNSWSLAMAVDVCVRGCRRVTARGSG